MLEEELKYDKDFVEKELLIANNKVAYIPNSSVSLRRKETADIGFRAKSLVPN